MQEIILLLLMQKKSSAPVGRNLFWVGGSASWDATAGSKWSLTSGGSGGAPIPTSIDNVAFDSNSGASTVTIATATANCANLNFTGFTGTLAGSTAINIFGSLTFATGMTLTYSGAITFNSTQSGKTITCNGKILSGNAIFNGVGGGWTLQDTFNIGFGIITITNGSLNTNGVAVTCSSISSNNSNIRSLTCGSSTFTLSSSITFTTSTNFTFSAASATFNYTSTGLLDFGSLAPITIGALNLSSNTGSTTGPAIVNRSSSDITIGTLTRTAASNQGSLLLSGNYTITTTLTFTGANTQTSRIAIINGNPGLTCQLTATGATKTFTNVDFLGITAVGNTPWTGTSMGDAGGNSGITFNSPVTRYLVTQTTPNNFYSQNNWASSSGGTNNASQPLPQDTIVIDSNSFPVTGRNLSLNSAPTLIPGLDFTNATNSPQLAVVSNTRTVGDIKLISTMSTGSTGSLIFSKWTGTQTLTTAGITIASPLQINVGGTFVCADSINSTSSLTLTSGTFNDGNFNHTFNSAAAGFSLSATVLNAAKIFNKGTGTYTFSGVGGWLASAAATTNLTFTDSGTIKYTNNSSSNKTFTPGGLTYNNFWNATSGSGAVIMNQGTTNSTWNDFKINAAQTQQFIAGTTTTFSTFTAVGTSGNVITIASSTAANHNLVSNSGTAVNCDYMSISHSQASGAAFVATNSTDGGNNSGWVIEPTGFLSTWKTNNAGVSSSNQVQLPFVSTGTYNCTVYWGDGTSSVITTWNQAQTLHTYASPGTYKIAITGTCHGFQFNNGGDCLKILNIAKWDILRLGNDTGYFYGCTNLTITATDNLDLTGTTLLTLAFAVCSSITTIPSINTWTTSSITDTEDMFINCTSFNQALSFNTAAVTSMREMFSGCTALNSSITFTTTSVTDFSHMFDFCSSFNQAVSFNTSAATNMTYMFDNCTAFNQDLSGFTITSLTAADHMMDGVTLSNANYNALLVSWSGQTTPQNNVVFSAGNSHYSGAGVAARGILTGTYNWTITDGGTP